MKKMWSVQTGFSLFALIVVCMVLFDHVCGVEPARRPAPPTVAQPEKPATEAAASPASGATPAPTGETLEAAIRGSADAFATAFARGDAAAVAALWTPDGEYVDDAGQRFSGRSEIERQYAKFFADHPDAKIEIKIDSIRPIGPDTAIEDGHAWLLPRQPGAAGSPYTVVHSRADGRWLMASVREPMTQSAQASPLEGLDWLVGSWHAEKDGVTMNVSYRWIANRSFLERTYTVEKQGRVTASGVQLIGQDAGHQEIQSWDFTADGGYAVGDWIAQADGWSIVTRGKLPGGKPTAADNYLIRVDANTLAWQSRERKVAGEPLPDTDEIWLHRDAAAE